MNYGEALQALKEGKRVQRPLWLRGDPGRYGVTLELVPPLAHPDGRMTAPTLMVWDGEFLRPFPGGGWDSLAEDWQVAE